MQVYINYPNPHITIHSDTSCNEIFKQHKEGQRKIKVTPTSLKGVLLNFIQDKYDFKTEKVYNDMWLDITLKNYEQEIGFVHIIQAILGQRYKPLYDAPVSIHCGRQ